MGLGGCMALHGMRMSCGVHRMELQTFSIALIRLLSLTSLSHSYAWYANARTQRHTHAQRHPKCTCGCQRFFFVFCRCWLSTCMTWFVCFRAQSSLGSQRDDVGFLRGARSNPGIRRRQTDRQTDRQTGRFFG